MRFLLVFMGMIAMVGCASTDSYCPKSSREKKTHAKSDLTVTPENVRTNFSAHVGAELAWAGIIKDIQFKETERTIRVAFEVEHRGFDWGGEPYELSSEGEGVFQAGWVVDKPARISYLKAFAKPGYMIVVHGHPVRMNGDVVLLNASSVRPINEKDFSVAD